MAVTKESLYNDTAILLGERRLASTSEAIELRYDLDSLYDGGAVDYCLEIVKPKYALKLDEITGSVSQGDDVALIGFGTFTVRERAARTGKNPQTGKPLQIPASKTVAFRPGKGLKDAVAK